MHPFAGYGPRKSRSYCGSSAVKTSASGDQSNSAGVQQETNRNRPRATWVRIYSVLLFVLLIVYFQPISLAIVQLLNLVVWLNARPAQPAYAFAFIVPSLAISLAVLMMIRLTVELCTGVFALLTNRFDEDHQLDATVAQTKGAAPRLHALIADVGSQIVAPLPDDVRITPQAECYVCEQRRFALTTQRELTLVLGLPHLSVLSAAELRVIIAHELAHFRGDTRLGVFLYRFLESLRAGNQRQKERRLAWIDPVFWYRWIYFHVLCLLAAPIFKHQELQADAVSASVHGGELTARTLLREWLLAHEFESLLENYSRPGADTPAGQNLFEDFRRRFRSFSPAAHVYLQQRLSAIERPFLFDSHPTMHDRCTAVRTYPDQDLLESTSEQNLLPDLVQLQQQFHRQLVVC